MLLRGTELIKWRPTRREKERDVDFDKLETFLPVGAVNPATGHLSLEPLTPGRIRIANS